MASGSAFAVKVNTLSMLVISHQETNGCNVYKDAFQGLFTILHVEELTIFVIARLLVFMAGLRASAQQVLVVEYSQALLIMLYGSILLDLLDLRWIKAHITIKAQAVFGLFDSNNNEGISRMSDVLSVTVGSHRAYQPNS